MTNEMEIYLCKDCCQFNGYAKECSNFHLCEKAYNAGFKQAGGHIEEKLTLSDIIKMLK